MLKNRSDFIPLAAIAVGTLWGLGVTGALVSDGSSGVHLEREMHIHVDRAHAEHDGEVVSVDVKVQAGGDAESPRIGIRSGERPQIRISPSVEVSTEGAEPLIYVDGVRLQDRSAMDELEPTSIDRIEVIKGQAAKELYGDEASGGVIQIFLKPEGGR